MFMANDHYRLFVAIETPQSVIGELARIGESLRQLLPRAALRWSRPEQFHLTLRFLGNVEVATVPALISSLENTCGRFAPLRLNAQGAGVFPNWKFPRVLWAGVTDATGQLGPLQTAVQLATATYTEQPAEASFQPHLTLARRNQLTQPGLKELERAVATLSEKVFVEWDVDAVHLMRSELSAHGAHHSVLARASLAK
jgi:RNA 2',3'-cyclic 3'-phosphodiesterase